MFGTIRKHQTWLWFIIVGAMVAGLVLFFSPASRSGGGARSDNTPSLGNVEGRTISVEDYQDARNEAELGYFLKKGEWPDQGPKTADFDVNQQTYHQIFWIQKLKDYNIEVDSDAAGTLGRAVLQGRENMNIQTFSQMLQQHHLSMEDFRRYLQHYIGIVQLASVVGLSGQLLPPQEAQVLYKRERQERATQAAFFTYSNYLFSVTGVTAQAVAQFYTNQMSVYREPDRVQVSYVSFSITNLFSQAEHDFTNLASTVDLNFRRLGTNFVLYGKTPEEAKAAIRERLIHQQAAIDAQKKAVEFATELFAMEPMQPGNLATLAQTKKLSAKVSVPFDEEMGPTEFDGGPNFARAAFALTPEEPFNQQPLVGDTSVYVIALEKRIPSGIPSLDQIRDRVTSDYKRVMAIQLARQAAGKFEQSLTNGLARGRTFPQLCAEARVTSVTAPPMSLATSEVPEIEEHVPLNANGGYKQMAWSVPPGKSILGYSRDGAFVVYVQRELPVDDAKMRADMPKFLAAIRQSLRQEALNDWFNRELPKSMRETPLFQQPPPGQAPPGSR